MSTINRAHSSLERPPEKLPGRLPPLTVAGNELTVFEESGALIPSMVADIRTAKQRVWLESYIFTEDAAGEAIAAALCERARAGVEVRVIYDAVGSMATSAAFFRAMEAEGVQVHAYHTFWHALWKLRLFRIFNRRSHRKLLIVDDLVAYFGGMNIVDQRGLESAEAVKAAHLPASAGWRDVHVRLTGPQLPEIAAASDRLWQRVHHRPAPRSRWPVKKMLTTPGETISFFDSRPNLKYHRPQRVLVPLIRRARRSITVSMAYFIPVGRVLRELVRARRRGVTVRVIIPGESDVKLVQWATRHFFSFLLRRGFRLYERRDQMLHSKVMVIDDEWTVIGSCNLDPRSLRLNLEFLSVIRSPAMAATIDRICRYEMRHSDRVTAAAVRRRSMWQRLRDRIAWSLRRWL